MIRSRFFYNEPMHNLPKRHNTRNVSDLIDVPFLTVIRDKFRTKKEGNFI